ncbi:hypothetical protein OF83DRAFT_1223345 [Amylostereum chailletii]|nr:hypothetical protein OF83DRAFT_1223345 [Amylostereum chailletii]
MPATKRSRRAKNLGHWAQPGRRASGEGPVTETGHGNNLPGSSQPVDGSDGLGPLNPCSTGTSHPADFTTSPTLRTQNLFSKLNAGWPDSGSFSCPSSTVN